MLRLKELEISVAVPTGTHATAFDVTKHIRLLPFFSEEDGFYSF